MDTPVPAVSRRPHEKLTENGVVGNALCISEWIVGNRKLRLRTRGDVRMNPSRTTPYGPELNVKRLAGDESAVASAPPPTSGRVPRGSPAAAPLTYPSG